jgi:hypothetical protein
MSVSGRTPRFLALSIGLVGWLACNGSSGPGAGSTGTAGAGAPTGAAGVGAAGAGQAGSVGGTGQAGASPSGAAGSTGTPGAAGTGAGVAGSIGSAGAGGGAAGAGAAGQQGAAGTGAAGTGAAGVGAAGTGAAGSAPDPLDTPPWRPLNVTAAPGLHSHGSDAAVDTRAKSLGKLSVDLGVSGAGFSVWLAKRGYHAVGSSFGECNAPNLGAGRDAVGTCRMGEWQMVETKVTALIKGLAVSAPAEDWGYFLTQDGSSVRWSDVAFSGVSHGATTAAIIGRLGARVWRVVSSAGPRDNTCGKGPFSLPYDPAKPPFDPACPDSDVASWLDMPTKTPMERFYAIDGVGDGEYGDIMFHLQRTMYPGMPVQFDTAGAVLTGTNRFISMGGGHLDFLNSADSVKPLNTNAVLNIAFAIPPANQNPTF